MAVILWISAFLLTFNLYLLATVLPAVVRDLHTSVSAVESALILLPLLSGLLVPTGRQLVEGYGRGRTVAWALLLYGAGQLTVAGSFSVAMLVTGFSLVAGAGGALLLAAAWSLVEECAEPEVRSTGTALLGAAPMAGGIVGPVVGGVAGQTLTWRLAFVAELALVVVILWLVRHAPQRIGGIAIRWTNGLAAPIGAALVLVGLGLGDDYGWWRAIRPMNIGPLHVAPFGLSIVTLLIGAGVLVLFVSAAGGAHVRLAPYLRPRFLAALGVGLSVGTSTTGAFYALRLYLSVGPRLDVLRVGISLAAFGLGALLVNLLVLLARRTLQSRVVVGVGIAVASLGVGLILMGLEGWGGGLGVVPGLFVLGAGNGLVLSRLRDVTLAAFGPDQRSDASAMNVGAGDLAYALGIAIMGAVFVGVAAHTIVTGIERQLIERQLALPPAARQQVEARLENELRTLSPAEQDAFFQAQPPNIRSAIQSVASAAFRQGIEAALEIALAGFGLALVLFAISSWPRGDTSPAHSRGP